MTQEKLADYLCVSYQAVSKWETGASNPDLSLILPLTKLFHITADELLSSIEKEPNVRYEELTNAYHETFKRIDLQKRYEICETAVAEYPGDIDFLSHFAWATFNRSACFEDMTERFAEEEKAIKLFAAVIRNCESEFMRGEAISGIVRLLSRHGRRDEAKQYADLLPDRNVMTRDDVKEFYLEGEELIKFKQLILLSAFSGLLEELSTAEYADSPDKIEALIKIMFEDGNYLAMNRSLYQAKKSLVNRLMNNGDTDRVMSLLRQMRVFAADYDECVYIKRGVYHYTSELLNRIEADTTRAQVTVETGLVNDFTRFLSDQKFDNLREREDFKALTKD